MNPLIPIYQKLVSVLTQLRDTLMGMETSVEPTVLAAPVATAPISRIHIWALAIAVQEGAKKTLNNPGNLKVSTLTEFGARRKDFKRPTADGSRSSRRRKQERPPLRIS